MAMTMQRDPYARGAYVRTCHANTGHEQCAQCGRTPRRLYTYTWEGDGTMRHVRRFLHAFCNFECFMDYNW
jgi:hypothetical protein